MMTRMREWMVVSMVAAAAIVGGAWWLAGANARVVPAPKLHVVTVGDIEETVAAVGSLEPREYVDVGTQVSGQLKSIKVAIGDRVEGGQLLAVIDSTVYETRVAADQAQLRVLNAQLRERQVDLALAERQYDRQRRLRETRTASEEAFDTADAARQRAAAQIEALKANIQQVEAQLRADQANLGYTRIHAPMSGIVIDINAREGQTLNANQQAPIILRLADLDVMTVRAQVAEADVAKLTIGMTARFTTLGRPDRERVGRLRQILPTPEVVNNVVLYNCLFDVGNPDLDLLPKMSAQTFFVVSKAQGRPLAPMAALRKGAHGRYRAQVMTENGPEDRIVTLVAENRVMAAVGEGLAVGDRLIIDPNGGAGGAPGDAGQRRRRSEGGPPPGMGPGAGPPP